MDKRITDLRERRDTLAKETRNLLEQNPGATWNDDHQKVYDQNMAEVGRIDSELSRLGNLAELETAGESRSGITVHDHIPDDMKVTAEQKKSRGILNKWLRGGDTALSAEDWTHVRNTMSTTTPAEGGYTVDSQVASELIKAQKAFGGMRSVATSFGTATGGPLSWPTMDDTGNVGEIVAENTQAADQDLAFGTVSLAVQKWSSKVVTVPIELLQDSEVNLESEVRGALAQRLARIQNTKFTTGTGTNEPRGIVTGAASGKVGTTGQTGTVIYDDLVDLEHSVDQAYRNLPGVGFMMNDASVKVIRKIKDSQGRPIFVPGYESGTPGGAPDTLLGRPITVNNDVAVMAANAKSILFGVLSNYRIRDVMAATLYRFTDSAYTKKGQVGFMAWTRAGGNLLDLSGATVKYYQNSAT